MTSGNLRNLLPSDIPDAMALKEAAGWNQTEADWALFLELVPDGCFAVEREGRVVATSTAVPHDGWFGWIGMMLVHPDERRRGHGTRVLEAAVSFLEARGRTAGLDATPLGKLLYDRYGFRALYPVERWVGTAPGGRAEHPDCAPLSVGDLGDVLALDRLAFGAGRAPVLRGLLDRASSFGLRFPREGEPQGYLILRAGSGFLHVGPWIARGAEAAGALWDTLLSRTEGREIGVDVPVPNAAARRLVEAAGLSAPRRPVRMVRGAAAGTELEGELLPGGRTDLVCALAGFAWG